MSIAENIKLVRSRIELAAKRAGRDPNSIKLVAATKDVPAGLIEEAVRAGVTDIGENRVQEAKQKFDVLKGLPVTWHMIGHLQTNKVKSALDVFSVIQSVDSERLMDEISNRAQKDIGIFIEVNTSEEKSKFGVSTEGAVQLARRISGLKNLKLTGLMTVGPLTCDGSNTRKSFRSLSGLFDQIKRLNLPSVELKYLSMGMSQDFEAAIEEGSNLVRIGRAIFGIPHQRQ
ncbi:MAG: YggS family pyridoxal phosphate-dependent enzyme [bacterium]